MTALMWAAWNGHSDTVKALLEAGADIEAKGRVSKRILHTHIHIHIHTCAYGYSFTYMTLRFNISACL